MSNVVDIRFVGIEEMLRKFGDLARLGIGSTMQKALVLFTGDIVREQLRGRPGLIYQKGALARSFHASVKGDGENIVGRVGSSSVYARIHQYGGVIRPKKAKFLAFKIHTGTRIFSKSGERLKKGVRQYSPMIFTKQVTIPKRLRVLEAFKTQGVARVRNALNRLMEQVLFNKGTGI